MNDKEKNILGEFRYLSESDLMIEIYNEILKYAVLTKSEEVAIKILEKYGKNACFDFNDWKKDRYFKLMIIANLMNFVVPIEWYNISITDDDIIKRIIEFRNEEIKWVNENSYVYDGSFHDNEENEFILLPSDIKIDEIITFYSNIIEKEFGSNKKLFK